MTVVLLILAGRGFGQIGGSAPDGLELPGPRPNEQVIRHTGYTLSYNSGFQLSSWVAYKLTAAQTEGGNERTNKFVPDPLLAGCPVRSDDYKGSGYDRGHLAPAADMAWSAQTMKESFYLSNMTPQEPGFNRGIWKRLEEQVRQWARDRETLYIATGPVLAKGLPVMGPHRIAVPKLFYKVVLCYADGTLYGIGIVMPNASSQEPLDHYAVTIDSVERLTGIDFFSRLPDSEEAAAESTVDLTKWSWTATHSGNHKKSGGTSVQCQGTTKAGNRCKNSTTNSNGYCYLHQDQVDGAQGTQTSAQTQSSRRTTSVRCAATTQKGTQCSRMTYSANGLCWQHGGN